MGGMTVDDSSVNTGHIGLGFWYPNKFEGPVIVADRKVVSRHDSALQLCCCLLWSLCLYLLLDKLCFKFPVEV